MMGGGGGGKTRPAEINPEAATVAVKTLPVTIKTVPLAVELKAVPSSVAAPPACGRVQPVAGPVLPPAALTVSLPVRVEEFGARVLQLLQGRRHGLFPAQVPRCTVDTCMLLWTRFRCSNSNKQIISLFRVKGQMCTFIAGREDVPEELGLFPATGLA